MEYCLRVDNEGQMYYQDFNKLRWSGLNPRIKPRHNEFILDMRIKLTRLDKHPDFEDFIVCASSDAYALGMYNHPLSTELSFIAADCIILKYDKNHPDYSVLIPMDKEETLALAQLLLQHEFLPDQIELTADQMEKIDAIVSGQVDLDWRQIEQLDDFKKMIQSLRDFPSKFAKSLKEDILLRQNLDIKTFEGRIPEIIKEFSTVGDFVFFDREIFKEKYLYDVGDFVWYSCDRHDSWSFPSDPWGIKTSLQVAIVRTIIDKIPRFNKIYDHAEAIWENNYIKNGREISFDDFFKQEIKKRCSEPVYFENELRN